MVDVIDLNSIAARRSGSSPEPLTDLIAAVEGLALVYEHGGRNPEEDDCMRLTINQARRLCAAARRGLDAQ